MLIYRRTSILESPAQTLVNTVNCVGVMGKGLAEAFKKREPVLEREMLKFFFKSFDELTANQRFAAADQKFANKKGKGATVIVKVPFMAK